MIYSSERYVDSIVLIPPQYRARFGVFELDLKAGELRQRGRVVLLQEQPFRVLLILV